MDSRGATSSRQPVRESVNPELFILSTKKLAYCSLQKTKKQTQKWENRKCSVSQFRILVDSHRRNIWLVLNKLRRRAVLKGFSQHTSINMTLIYCHNFYNICRNTLYNKQSFYTRKKTKLLSARTKLCFIGYSNTTASSYEDLQNELTFLPQCGNILKQRWQDNIHSDAFTHRGCPAHVIKPQAGNDATIIPSSFYPVVDDHYHYFLR